MRSSVLVLTSMVVALGIVSCKRSTGAPKADAEEAGSKSVEAEQSGGTSSAEEGAAGWAEKLFGDTLVNRDEEEVSISDLKDDKKIGLYFSAHWCPPCRVFTPKLVEVYNKWQEEEKPFEIVLVGLDRTEDDMYGYMDGEDMEWLALPFDGPRQQIAQKFGVRGIPSLVILNEDGEVITNNGRGDVMKYGEDAYERW